MFREFQKPKSAAPKPPAENLRHRIWPVNTSMTLGSDYIQRAFELRRAGKIPIILVRQSRYWISEDPSDPWGGRVAISHEALRAMIDELDPANAPASADKKPPLKTLVSRQNRWEPPLESWAASGRR